MVCVQMIFMKKFIWLLKIIYSICKDEKWTTEAKSGDNTSNFCVTEQYYVYIFFIRL